MPFIFVLDSNNVSSSLMAVRFVVVVDGRLQHDFAEVRKSEIRNRIPASSISLFDANGSKCPTAVSSSLAVGQNRSDRTSVARTIGRTAADGRKSFGAGRARRGSVEVVEREDWGRKERKKGKERVPIANLIAPEVRRQRQIKCYAERIKLL